MKNLFLAAVTALSLFSCEDNDQNPNVLPPATQTGKNTGGALVDGQVWVAKIQNPNLYNGGVDATMYEHFGNTYRLTIKLRHINDGSRMAIVVESDKEITAQSYVLSVNNVGGYSKGTFDSGYRTNSDCVGNLTITKFDIEKQIVSGTFNFKAQNMDDNNDTVEITDGRFDKKFIGY